MPVGRWEVNVKHIRREYAGVILNTNVRIIIALLGEPPATVRRITEEVTTKLAFEVLMVFVEELSLGAANNSSTEAAAVVELANGWPIAFEGVAADVEAVRVGRLVAKEGLEVAERRFVIGEEVDDAAEGEVRRLVELVPGSPHGDPQRALMASQRHIFLDDGVRRVITQDGGMERDVR